MTWDSCVAPRRTAFGWKFRESDDQSVALPPADRMAEPLPFRRIGVLGVQADDAGVVDHLDEDHHVVLSLHDALEVVVEAREGRRGAGEADDAALGDRERFRTVVRTVAFDVEPPGRAVVRPS